jgi:metal-responsive CopG/Arc/MetJ family transcriptional regulator
MSGRNVNIYLPEETYNQIKNLIEKRKVSKFINEAIQEKLGKQTKENDNNRIH